MLPPVGVHLLMHNNECFLTCFIVSAQFAFPIRIVVINLTNVEHFD
jgi:hypothetical protein